MKKNIRLKALLFARGITAGELAKQVSIPRPYLSLAMSGRYNFEADEQVRIAKALGVLANQIFGDAEGHREASTT